MAFEADRKQHDDDTPLPSERNFGVTFAVVFAVIALIRLPFGGPVLWWALAVSTAFLIVTCTAPRILAPLNRVWFRFGMLLHRIVNPVVLAVLYFGALVPMSLVMRAFGKRFLTLDRDVAAASYWVKRDPPGPAPDSIKNQF